MFTDETKRRIDELVSRYPKKAAALLPALWVAQEVYGGWLPEEAIGEVADYLELPRAEAMGVATFYTMFNTEQVGRHRIEICHNISCMILGAEQLIHHCEQRLGIAAGETTANGEFTLERVECLGACCNPPAVQIGGRYFENVTAERMDGLIEQLKTAPSEVASPAQAGMPEMRTF